MDFLLKDQGDQNSLKMCLRPIFFGILDALFIIHAKILQDPPKLDGPLGHFKTWRMAVGLEFGGSTNGDAGSSGSSGIS